MNLLRSDLQYETTKLLKFNLGILLLRMLNSRETAQKVQSSEPETGRRV